MIKAVPKAKETERQLFRRGFHRVSSVLYPLTPNHKGRQCCTEEHTVTTVTGHTAKGFRVSAPRDASVQSCSPTPSVGVSGRQERGGRSAPHC